MLGGSAWLETQGCILLCLKQQLTWELIKKARGEIWPKRSERRNNTKNYQDEDKKSAINKN